VSGREGQDQPAPKDTAGYPGSVVESPGGFDGAHPPNNLPLQLSSFVGRNREVAEIEVLLADNRLLTLTGPAGSGKTRLALAVAHEVMGSYEDGAWLVELAPLSDPELVSQALASVLGVPANRAPRRSPRVQNRANRVGQLRARRWRLRLALSDPTAILPETKHPRDQPGDTKRQGPTCGIARWRASA
jgi:hypothetical protein